MFLIPHSQAAEKTRNWPGLFAKPVSVEPNPWQKRAGWIGMDELRGLPQSSSGYPKMFEASFDKLK
jgi:hypothetical protein